MAAARSQAAPRLESLARRIDPAFGWDDLVAPDDTILQLRELCERVRDRKRVIGDWGFGGKLARANGATALFAGPSGTGKTMAAEIVAGELGLELYRIDLAGVVSKYIGETEKNLDRVFAAAETGSAVLLFDEADALFGKRSEVRDAHDRYANLEVAYLLQRLESYDGLAVLTSNLAGNVEEAFARRLAFTIHFPFPELEDRRRIWHIVWPAEAPVGDDVDFDLLAQELRLAGGGIRNAAIAAAFAAAADGGVVRMAHVLHGARREFQKLGRETNLSTLGGRAA
jgi:SpoVK/Ycf46/Vps4 family AAA+-type ATPase